MQDLLERMDILLPSCVHVAGTNGKGSVSLKIQRAFTLSGYKVGLFSSPHLITFRERIRIGDEMVEEEDLLDCFRELIEKTSGLNYSYFEFIFALALTYYIREKVDLIVVETGLGGRLDATNVITPILSIITSIGFDHQNMLGDTLEKIAGEKAGIIKENVPVIIGERASYTAILNRAKELGAPLTKVRLKEGFFDDENSQIAKEALLSLQKKYSLKIEHALTVRPKCRFEVIEKEIPIVLDVAHNPEGMRALLKALKKYFPGRSLRFLLAFSRDKEMQEMVDLVPSSIHFTSNSHARIMPLEQIKKEIHLKMPHSFGDVKEEFEKAYSEAKKRGEVLVCAGTFFIMKDIYSLIDKKYGI